MRRLGRAWGNENGANCNSSLDLSLAPASAVWTPNESSRIAPKDYRIPKQINTKPRSKQTSQDQPLRRAASLDPDLSQLSHWFSERHLLCCCPFGQRRNRHSFIFYLLSSQFSYPPTATSIVYLNILVFLQLRNTTHIIFSQAVQCVGQWQCNIR